MWRELECKRGRVAKEYCEDQLRAGGRDYNAILSHPEPPRATESLGVGKDMHSEGLGGDNET